MRGGPAVWSELQMASKIAWQLQKRDWHGQPQDRIYLGHWAEGGWNRARNRLGDLGVVLLLTGGT